MKLTLLLFTTLAGTAIAGPLSSDADIRAHLARGSVSINNGQESTRGLSGRVGPRGFSQRGGPHGPSLEDAAALYPAPLAKNT